MAGHFLRRIKRTIRRKVWSPLRLGTTRYGGHQKRRIPDSVSSRHQYAIPNDSSAKLQSDCNVLCKLPSEWCRTCTHLSKNSSENNNFIRIEVDNDSCNSYNGFHFQTDGTTNLFHRKARTVCGTQELLVIISKYNSLVFGTTSKHYSGVFSCNVTTIAHREPCDCGWSHSHVISFITSVA